MAKNNWQQPPLIQAALRLQKLSAELKKRTLETQLQRATRLLDQQMRQAKRNE